MKSASIGTPAASPSPRDGGRRRAGFTLLEALVALALVLAFAGVLGPLLFHARRIMVSADGRVAAHVLLRSLLEVDLDRDMLAKGSQDGETAGLSWRVIAEPMDMQALLPPGVRPVKAERSADQARQAPDQEAQVWIPYRVVASVSWGPGRRISAETVRLGKLQ